MLFDFERFYSEVAYSLPDNAVIAEIGLAEGRSMIFLAETLLEMKKKFKLFAIDNCAYGGSFQSDIIKENIRKAGLSSVIEFQELDSLVASAQFGDQDLHFAFIDSSHKHQQTKQEIRCWLPKIKDGYLLAGHDYNDNEGKEVKQAVNELIPTTHLRTVGTDKGHNIWCVNKDKSFISQLNNL